MYFANEIKDNFFLSEFLFSFLKMFFCFLCQHHDSVALQLLEKIDDSTTVNIANTQLKM